MIRRFNLDGQLYSQNKKEIKASWRGLRWIGDRDHCEWKSDSPLISIVANFSRKDGVTTTAEIIYSGPKDNKILSELTQVMNWLGVKEFEDEESSQTEDSLEKRIQMEIEVRIGTWDLMNRPNVEYMKKPSSAGIHRGAPPQFIEKALEDYKNKRIKRVAELRKEIEEEWSLNVERTEEEENEQFINDVLTH